VTDVLKNELVLESKREGLSRSPKLYKKPKAKNFERPTTVDEAVDLLMSEMKLRDLNKLARMPRKISYPCISMSECGSGATSFIPGMKSCGIHAGKFPRISICIGRRCIWS